MEPKDIKIQEEPLYMYQQLSSVEANPNWNCELPGLFIIINMFSLLLLAPWTRTPKVRHRFVNQLITAALERFLGGVVCPQTQICKENGCL